MSCKLRIHELAALLPQLTGDAFESMCADIAAHGQIDPIVISADVILDGKHRKQICEKLGIKPKYVEFSTLNYKGTPEDFIWSKGMQRRDLTEDQRAIFTTQYESYQEGKAAKARQKAGNAKGGATPRGQATKSVVKSPPTPDSGKTRTKLAEKAKVSQNKIRQAQVVMDAGDAGKELMAKVASGELKLAQAAKQVAPPPKPRPVKAPEFDIDWEATECDTYIMKTLERCPENLKTEFLEKLELQFRSIWTKKMGTAHA